MRLPTIGRPVEHLRADAGRADAGRARISRLHSRTSQVQKAQTMSMRRIARLYSDIVNLRDRAVSLHEWNQSVFRQSRRLLIN